MNNSKQKIPELRFQEFGNEWSLFKLSHFLEERIEVPKGYLPLYSLTIEDGIVPKSERYERSFLVNDIESAYKKMLKNDFAFNPMNLRFGALARHKQDEDIAVSKYYNIFYCKDNADPRFMEYFLKSYNMIQYYNKMATGSLEEKKRVHYLDFINFQFYFPGYDEQKRIADFLSTIEKKIELLITKKRFLERYRNGVLDKLFSQEIRFKNKDGEYYPRWEDKILGDLLDYEQPTKYIVTSTEYSDDYELPVLTAGKTFILGYTNETSGVFRKKLPVIIFDDFTTAFKYVDFPFKVKSSAMKILISKEGVSDIKFIYEAMKKIDFKLSGHKRYWISEYQKEKIKYAGSEERDKIVNYLNLIDGKILCISDEINEMQKYLKGSIQKMFVWEF